jgi:hypothetical protein
VIYDGYVYAVGRGKANCFELETGRMQWQHDIAVTSEIASPIIADGKLIAVVARDRLLMMAATPEHAKVLAELDAKVKFSPSPAIANGLLYLRHFDRIACYDLKLAATP